MESDASQANREEKEAQLNKRMEEMRLKNAALQKRHQEVLADKRNAEILSNKFQESRQLNPQPVPTSQPSNPSKDSVTKSRPPAQPKGANRARYNEMIGSQKLVAPDVDKKRAQRLAERHVETFLNMYDDVQIDSAIANEIQDEGPPPDPGYRFLADRRREGSSQPQQQQHFEERNQGSRRHAGNYGGQDFENVKSSMQRRKTQEKGDPRQGPRNKMEMAMRMTGRERHEYEKWKCERSRIEEDRVNRHKTSSGEWRREWDRDKNSTDEELEPPPPQRNWESYRGGASYGDGGSRNERGSNSRRRGTSRHDGQGSYAKYTDEHDEQRAARADFDSRDKDFPSLSSSSNRESRPPASDSRTAELNRNNIKVSVGTDKNDNFNTDAARETWRKSSGGMSSQSEEEVAPPRKGDWRSRRQENRAKARAAPRSPIATATNWTDQKRHSNRESTGQASESSIEKPPVSQYSDLREVLNRATAAKRLPPLSPPEAEPDKQATDGGVVQENAELWEDEGSWEDAASNVGSSQGCRSSEQSQETESFDTAVSPEHKANAQSDVQHLDAGIRELSMKHRELLATSMGILDMHAWRLGPAMGPVSLSLSSEIPDAGNSPPPEEAAVCREDELSCGDSHEFSFDVQPDDDVQTPDVESILTVSDLRNPVIDAIGFHDTSVKMEPGPIHADAGHTKDDIDTFDVEEIFGDTVQEIDTGNLNVIDPEAESLTAAVNAASAIQPEHFVSIEATYEDNVDLTPGPVSDSDVDDALVNFVPADSDHVITDECHGVETSALDSVSVVDTECFAHTSDDCVSVEHWSSVADVDDSADSVAGALESSPVNVIEHSSSVSDAQVIAQENLENTLAEDHHTQANDTSDQEVETQDLFPAGNTLEFSSPLVRDAQIIAQENFENTLADSHQPTANGAGGMPEKESPVITKTFSSEPSASSSSDADVIEQENFENTLTDSHRSNDSIGCDRDTPENEVFISDTTKSSEMSTPLASDTKAVDQKELEYILTDNQHSEEVSDAKNHEDEASEKIPHDSDASKFEDHSPLVVHESLENLELPFPNDQASATVGSASVPENGTSENCAIDGDFELSNITKVELIIQKELEVPSESSIGDGSGQIFEKVVHDGDQAT